jgi:hypothetical protein
VQIANSWWNSQLWPELILVDDAASEKIPGALASRLSVPSRPRDRGGKVGIRQWIPGLLVSLHEMLEMILGVSQAQDGLRRHGQDGVVY